MQNWRESLVQPSYSIRQTIEVIDQSALKVALVIDENGRLIGTVTDGDIRRALLKGVQLGEPVVQIMHAQPFVVQPGAAREDVVRLMKAREIKHVPVVDGNGVLQGVHTVEEFLGTSPRDNWVVLMAGGLGSRLAPLTDKCPKPMLKIGDKPILETIVNNFAEQGFSRFFFSVNYMADMIKNHFRDGSRWGVTIEYLEETKKLGTAGSLSLLQEQPNLPCIVMNGDLLTKVDFRSLMDFHTEHQSSATMCVREYDFQVPYGVVNVDGERITEIVEKPVHRFFVNAGIYCLAPEALAHIPRDEFFDMPSLFQQLIGQGSKTCSFPIREYWLDIGRISDFERANAEFMEVFE